MWYPCKCVICYLLKFCYCQVRAHFPSNIRNMQSIIAITRGRIKMDQVFLIQHQFIVSSFVRYHSLMLIYQTDRHCTTCIRIQTMNFSISISISSKTTTVVKYFHPPHLFNQRIHLHQTVDHHFRPTGVFIFEKRFIYIACIACMVCIYSTKRLHFIQYFIINPISAENTFIIIIEVMPEK